MYISSGIFGAWDNKIGIAFRVNTGWEYAVCFSVYRAVWLIAFLLVYAYRRRIEGFDNRRYNENENEHSSVQYKACVCVYAGFATVYYLMSKMWVLIMLPLPLKPQ
jgi:hypothetical protein